MMCVPGEQCDCLVTASEAMLKGFEAHNKTGDRDEDKYLTMVKQKKTTVTAFTSFQINLKILFHFIDPD